MCSSRSLPRFTNPRTELPFVFKSYIRLAEDLGRVDGLASAIVLSTRYFDAAASAAADKQAYALAQAREHGISTRYVSFPDLPSHTSQLLLVGVYQQAEAFLGDLRKEIVLFGRAPWRPPDDGESRLRYTLDCIGPTLQANIQAVGEERYRLFEYYRMLRNGFVHLNIARERLRREFNTVSGYRQLVQDEFNLNAPNAYDQLSYDDFLLFTRLSKYLATDLCYLAAPGDPELLTLLRNLEAADEDKPLTALRARRGTAAQALRKIRSWFSFNYRVTIANRPEAERLILDEVMALPNKRARRRLTKT